MNVFVFLSVFIELFFLFRIAQSTETVPGKQVFRWFLGYIPELIAKDICALQTQPNTLFADVNLEKDESNGEFLSECSVLMIEVSTVAKFHHQHI